MEINRNSLMYHIASTYGFANYFDDETSVSKSTFVEHFIIGILFAVWLTGASVFVGYSLLSLLFWAMMVIQYDAILPFSAFNYSGVIIVVGRFIWFLVDMIIATFKEIKKSNNPKTVTFTDI